MTSRADLIARTVLDQFDKLPAKRKPPIRDNGIHEWVPLSGIVAERDGHLTCLALATGMKCLPLSKMSASNGVGIHDWHAEVLAMRAFNRFLLHECLAISEINDASSILLTRTGSQGDTHDGGNARRPFQIRDDVKLHMYCSEAPCGDASMELTIAAQEDASPWEHPAMPPVETTSTSEGTLPGRAFFSQLGIVRRKPARGDAPQTLSKSCSDKLALKQCTSLLSSLTALFVDPRNAYIDILILPESQYSAVGCKRSFSAAGRMKSVAGKQWAEGYSFRPFSIETTALEFEFSKRAVQVRSERTSASNLAAAWSLSGVEENIVGGVIQGRKAFDRRGASCMSRRQMWTVSSDIASQLGDSDELISQLSGHTYEEVKLGPLLAVRREVKADTRRVALTGWVENEGDSSFTIDHAA